MQSSRASLLETPVEGLRTTPPSRLLYQANVLVRSFFLEWPASNVVVYHFDVLVPWGTTEGNPCFAQVDKAEIRERVDALIARVGAGGNR